VNRSKPHSPAGIGRTASRGHSRCAVRCSFSPHPVLSLGRNDAVGKGKRDRPGRSVRRLAEQLVRQTPLTVWCSRAIAARIVGGTPTRAVETTALPSFKHIVPAWGEGEPCDDLHRKHFH